MNPNDPINLRNILNAAPPSQRMGSGYFINMPDGKGGKNQVPVELATVLLLDQIASTLNQVLEEMQKKPDPAVATEVSFIGDISKQVVDAVKEHLPPEATR